MARPFPKWMDTCGAVSEFELDTGLPDRCPKCNYQATWSPIYDEDPAPAPKPTFDEILQSLVAAIADLTAAVKSAAEPK